jgi:U6 snRNA-associated Sm-like protein LSm6
MSLRKQTPSDFLKQIIGRPVVVKLNSGVDYRGRIFMFDRNWYNQNKKM